MLPLPKATESVHIHYSGLAPIRYSPWLATYLLHVFTHEVSMAQCKSSEWG